MAGAEFATDGLEKRAATQADAVPGGEPPKTFDVPDALLLDERSRTARARANAPRPLPRGMDRSLRALSGFGIRHEADATTAKAGDISPRESRARCAPSRIARLQGRAVYFAW